MNRKSGAKKGPEKEKKDAASEKRKPAHPLLDELGGADVPEKAPRTLLLEIQAFKRLQSLCEALGKGTEGRRRKIKPAHVIDLLIKRFLDEQ